jgi:gamma-glutamyltranspeptidase / glutathione hydrolase
MNKISEPRLAIASGSRLGADAAAVVAGAGGNAVDACLAAAVMAWVAEPCLASLAGGGFIVVRAPDGVVEVFEGNSTMPHSLPVEPGQGIERIFAPDYSDGLHTGVGPGSVAVPGILAGIHAAWQKHGQIEWPALFTAAISAARHGISFPRTSAYFISATWNELWSLFDSGRALFAPDGEPLAEGELLVQADLAETLQLIASEGPDVLYSGEVARAMTEQIAAEGGFLTVDDLSRYEVQVRPPILTEAFGWRIESNPPPAVGGAGLTHMLALLEDADLTDPVGRLSAIVEAQRAAAGYREERYDDPADVAGALQEALDELRRPRSSSTTHTSAADSDGYVCSLTETSGYGAGLVVCGVVLNNTLGEEELNPLGIHRLPPGSRCHSNMAPTIATGPDRIVGIGSPGANRIVTAIAQTLIRIAVDGNSLADAVAAPRAHLDPREQGETLCYEPGLPGEELNYITRPYDEVHMYFGGVQAASVDSSGAVDAAYDPRRSGACALV